MRDESRGCLRLTKPDTDIPVPPVAVPSAEGACQARSVIYDTACSLAVVVARPKITPTTIRLRQQFS